MGVANAMEGALITLTSNQEYQVTQTLCSTYSLGVKEAKELWKIALPVTGVNLVLYLRSMISVLCMGKLGSIELAGGALAVGFTNITGYSILSGLASGMEGLCSQAYGSGNWALLGATLWKTVLLLAVTSLPIGFLWSNVEHIMVDILHQDAEIAKVAAEYCKWALPDLVASSIAQPLRVYMRSQGMATPMMWCSLFAVACHAPLTYALMRLGVHGVATATWITNLHMTLLLLAYVVRRSAWRKTWAHHGKDDRASVSVSWWGLLRLAVPSCAAVCLEWWWYELLTVLAGFLPEPRVTLAAAGIVIQTTSLMYNFPVALAAAVSARVGNELGSSHSLRARHATVTAMLTAAVIGLLSFTLTNAFSRQWASIFTNDTDVLALLTKVLPIVGLCELGNCPQTTGCGVLRGSARPSLGATINLLSFYAVGTPVALVFGFALGWGFEGLCYGLVAAQAACACLILLMIARTDWDKETDRARQLTCAADIGDEEKGLLVETPS